MNSATISKLQQKFQKRVSSIRDSDFDSLQDTLGDFWALFNNEVVLIKIADASTTLLNVELNKKGKAVLKANTIVKSFHSVYVTVY